MGVSLLPKSAGVKTLSYTITMPPQLVERMKQAPKGVGGWQSLMTDLQSQVEGTQLEVSQTLLAKMIPMATNYGAGGYQGVIRWILCLLLAQHTDALIGVPQTLTTEHGPKTAGKAVA